LLVTDYSPRFFIFSNLRDKERCSRLLMFSLTVVTSLYLMKSLYHYFNENDNQYHL